MRSFAIKISAVAVTCTALLFTGCKKGDAYYTNPNLPTDATVKNLLSALEVSTMNSYESDIARSSSILIQHTAGVDNPVNQVNNYQLLENQLNPSWTQLYQAINTGEILVAKSATSPRYRGIAKVCLALNWGLLTDIWGDVPYTEAVSGVKFPKYDSQEQVLNGIQTLLDEAITDLQSANADNVIITGADDLIFSGDAGKWTKTAWTLKARYLNRLSKKPGYNPAAILDALSKGITNIADDCMAKHGKSGTESNQWWAFQRQRATNCRAAQPFVDSIKLRPADARLAKYFHPYNNGEIVGSPINTTTQAASGWGAYMIGPADDAATPFLEGNAETPAPLVTSFEALFIGAEVLARQGTRQDEAAIALNNAIKASYLKVTGTEDAPIANYNSGTVNLGRVMYEKWIAMFGQCEAYSDYRRTGMPALTPNSAPGPGSAIPKRFPTPTIERSANPNAPTPAVSLPVWWAE